MTPEQPNRSWTEEDWERYHKERPKEEAKIYYAPDLIAIYREFQEKVYDPKSVLYPSCGFDEDR